MACQTRLHFNPATPNIMHIDLNSCFASVEQQANPLLRDKPIAVVHSDAPYGCILAPSVEAKLWGIKTGMNLKEGRDLCPWLIARVADPDKYREVHGKFAQLLDDYSNHIIPKSIDEFAVSLRSSQSEGGLPNLQKMVTSIKSRIKMEIGDYLRVSIGVSTNQVLAKLASGLHKPDGFDIIDKHNFMDIYDQIPLQELCGINVRNEARLHRVGIFTVRQFYEADIQTLKSAFESILGRYWYTRLRGYEVDDIEFKRRSFGQSYVLPHPMDIGQWRPILAKLVAKAARRLRKHGCSATAVHLYLRFGDGTSWHAGHQLHHTIFTDHELLDAALSLQRSDPCLRRQVCKKVKKIAVTFFGLEQDHGQLSCLRDLVKEKSLATCQDQINDKWGEYTLSYGSFLGSTGHVRDAIAFGK